MNNLLTHIQPYINYEAKRIVEETLKNNQSRKSGNKKRRNDKTKSRHSRFTDYTPLYSLWQLILRECLNAKFKEAGIKAPQPLRAS